MSRARVKDDFSWQEKAEDLHDLLDETLNRATPRRGLLLALPGALLLIALWYAALL